MLGWVAVLAAVGYIAVLFAIASYGDRAAARSRPQARPLLYALALSVYCTSWTFFGSVGVASRSGWEFLPIYIGPILMFTAGYPILRRVVQLSKAERITSIADFLGARYGKRQSVAVVTTMIVALGVIPYIALQLKAISASVATMVPGVAETVDFPIIGDIALLIACSLALFSILFGTRHADATEHQDGMMLAVAAEAVVKLLAFLVVGVYVTFFLFDGPGELYSLAAADPEIIGKFTRELAGGSWLTMTLLSFFACLLLPRQFHVGVVENYSPSELRRAVWLFPAYLVTINLFVVPVALAGIFTFGKEADGDLFVLELPFAAGADVVTLIAFLGGLSAATAMVIVASVALAIMISNELLVPLMLRGRSRLLLPTDMGRFILNIRRSSIVLVVLLGYFYYRVAGTAALASIGLLSFAAVAQLAPAFFGGLIWRRATAGGAIAGMTAGIAVWAYTLLLPDLVRVGFFPAALLADGPFGISVLRPQALFHISFDPLTHSVFWSLLANAAAYVGVSLMRQPQPAERLQANVFVPQDRVPSPKLRPLRTNVRVGELQETAARYLGQERSERSFLRFAHDSGRELDPRAPADLNLLRFTEHLLASAIGAASARLVLALLINRDDPSPVSAQRLLDDAEAALHYNRDLLQNVLDRIDQGIGVFDPDLRLVCWNRAFRQLLDLPPEHGTVGVSFRVIVRHLAEAGLFGPGDPDALADRTIERILGAREGLRERHPATGRLLTVEPRPIGDSGIAFTVTDITERAESEAELERARATLEKRVAERTEELTRLNAALEKANAAAEEANIGKTRFIAAAGHDILQPLNAARLYATALSERVAGTPHSELARNIETALDGVEEIFRAVLELSRLDTGHLKPDVKAVRIGDLLERVRVEFGPEARAKRIRFCIVPSALVVRTDPQLLARLLQNLVSNAVKYTPAGGRIVVGCRRKRGRLSLEVVDTGIGISAADQKLVFQEFRRLDAGARAAPGLGLGLSIVERIARVLKAQLTFTSSLGRGTHFRLSLPLAAATMLPTEAQPAVQRAAELSSGMVVLCIDNDAKILTGMEALLSGWGCAPIAAPSARAALRVVRAAPRLPDLMLVDYHLDDGNGLSAIAELRAKTGVDIPAILITADRSGELREAAMKAGIRVLNKPLKPAALRALMAQWAVARPAAE
ncbi:PAS-domain containing protein [Faunimonas sp. B44]|uniref:PAS-domain containing protein n=1 Tax=Faunimonas sp. B44 TaxID=3461493 RepID=UPI004044E117